MTWIQTYSGRRFDFEQIDTSSISIEDIAHALSLQCRFNGHTRKFYSVAQHSVIVSHLTGTLEGLLHDAAEAYMGDCVRPLKGLVNEAWKPIEQRVERAIAARFGLIWPWPAEVDHFDHVMLATEARDLLLSPPISWASLPDPLDLKIECWEPAVAKAEFLFQFGILEAKRSAHVV